MLGVGSKAPEFQLSDQDGNTVNITDFKGKKVLLTGVTGDVGSVLANSFLKSGAKLFGVGRSPEKVNAMEDIKGTAKYVSIDFPCFLL